jgi:hypothetical protein
MSERGENSMSLDKLRSYKLTPNLAGEGIVLFDLVLTFVGAFVLDYYFKLHQKLPGLPHKQYILFYGSLVPLGVLAHVLFGVDTFLLRKLKEKDMNNYKIAAIVSALVMAYALLPSKYSLF